MRDNVSFEGILQFFTDKTVLLKETILGSWAIIDEQTFKMNIED